jgi:hypothetical protein
VQVIRSRFVPQEEKKVYVLQFALLAGICLMGVFEDLISSSGRGTIVGLLFFPAAIICEVHGFMLLNKYAVSKLVNNGNQLSGPVIDAEPQTG